MVFLGTVISVSSSNWMFVWLGLELNMVSFLGWMCMSGGSGYSLSSGWGELDEIKFYPPNVEPFIKYFLVQSIGSAFFLFFPLAWGFYSISAHSSFFLLVGLFLKSGIAPFHQWFPSVCSNVSWRVNILLMFWQKIGPMFIMVTLTTSKLMFLSVISCLNLFFGVFGAMGQTQLRSLFAYSSITHMGWMVMMMYFSKLGFIYYFLVYSVLVVSLVSIFGFISMYSFNDMKRSIGITWFYMICSLLSVLSIGGIPPFSGFFMKIYSLFVIVWGGNFILSLVFCLFAAMSLSYYLNFVFSCLLLCIFSNCSYYNINNSDSSLWSMGGNMNLILLYLSIGSAFFVAFLSALVF